MAMNPKTHKRSSSQVEALEEWAFPRRPKIEELWSDDEHRSLDNDIMEKRSFQTPTSAIDRMHRLLFAIIFQVEKKTEVTDEDLLQLLHNNPTFKETLVGAWHKGSFKEIRNHAILRPKASDRSYPVELESTTSSLQQEATVQSWLCDFKGEADETLFAILKNYLAWTQALDGISDSPCANLVPIVNSSGTGKSRVVDQLGRKHCFVIPLCLRREGTNGYPPPDGKVRDWLLKKRETEQQLDNAVVAFLRALFDTARDRIAAIPRPPISSKPAHTMFTEYMNNGGSFETHPAYRTDFYAKVVELATKFETEIKTMQQGQVFYLESNKDVRAAASSFLSECGHEAIAVVSFDEAHELAKPIIPSKSSLGKTSLGKSPSYSGPSSGALRQDITMFSQIFKGLCAVMGLNIMGLSLSTSLRYMPLSPEPHHDPSSRSSNAERAMFPPITELGFDQLALPLNDPLTLRHVTTVEYISHLGRPLFATRWDAGDKSIQNDLLDFARSKLAPRPADRATNVLACLAARFAVEFRPRNERQEDIERTLVENHMRYCNDADSHLRVATFAPTEPLLAEVAFECIYYSGYKEAFLRIVAENVNTWGIHQGDRGEFVMSLIWMAARDAVVVRGNKMMIDRRPWDPYRHSVISIADWMKQLLPTNYHQQLESMRPSVVSDGTVTPVDFSLAFEGCRLWCNHFIQVQDYDVIHTKFLCALLSNGIGVLCVPNEAGIDLLWIGLKGDVICEENLVLILGQARNDRDYQSEPNGVVLDTMDPVKFGICGPNRSIPIIRMVFALASEVPGVTLVTPPSQRKKDTENKDTKTKRFKFTSYDFWFARVDPSTFGCITDKDAEHYQDLLASSRLLYNPPLPVPQDLRHSKKFRKLEEETRPIGEARVDMRRAANKMRMAFKPHFRTTLHQFVFDD